MTISCPICSNSIENSPFYETVQPVNENVLFENIESAKLSAIGKISLVFCDKCSFVFNTDFDLSTVDYSENYQYTLPPSAQFMKFIDHMVQTLIDDEKVKNKTILELGCGKGEFLHEICSRGKNKGLGYDTCYEGPKQISDPEIQFFDRFYSSVLDSKVKADFLIARQTLEHIESPHAFVLDMLSALKFDGNICLETPNLDWILDNCTFWDFYYEHCSYYNLASYKHLLAHHGLNITSTYYWFDKQYMSVISQPAKEKQIDLPSSDLTKARIESFTAQYQKKKSRIVNFCREQQELGQLVIWGGAAKGVTFCNIFWEVLEKAIVVDINPIRQNKFVPCVGNKIISPLDLKSYAPKTILVMNHQYIDEISRMCRELNIHANIVALDLV